MDKKIKRNALRCKSCNDVIESKHRHDYVKCSCGKVMVDGGRDYLRFGWPQGEPDDYVELLTEYY